MYMYIKIILYVAYMLKYVISIHNQTFVCTTRICQYMKLFHILIIFIKCTLYMTFIFLSYVHIVYICKL